MINIQGNNIKNITHSIIQETMRKWASGNAFIKTHTTGDIFEIDLNETNYALSHLSIEGAVYNKRELTYRYKLYVMDLVSKDESNEDDVLSDMLQVVGDAISYLRFSDYLISKEYELRLNENVNCTPFTERFDNEVTGWVADLEFTVDWSSSYCNNEI